MTILQNTVKVTIQGTAPGGEQFQTGFWLRDTPINSQAAANTLASAVVTSLGGGLLAFLVTAINADTAYTAVRVYAYPSGGPLASFVGEALIAGGTGTSTAASLPLQIASVATLHTGFAGRRYRGRMYFPVNALALTAHQFNSSLYSGLSSNVRAFFVSVNGIAGVGEVVVLSQVGTGDAVPVTSVFVDSRPDVQRRRAASLTPAGNTVTPL